MSSIISTWGFSQRGTQAAIPLLQSNTPALSVVEAAIQHVELDSTVTSVGYGGLPNADGTLQLDAALMAGDGRAGAVMALEGHRAAIPIARLVLHRSPHTLLAGDGAQRFAAEHGMPPAERAAELLSPHARERYEQFLREGAGASQRHGEHGAMGHTDTVGVIARDATGALAAGCATSGMQFKQPGRVGDSPVLGAGLYADAAAGAAVASGDGDQMMRFCIAFLVVERMRAGRMPDDACRDAMFRVRDADPHCQAAVAAMDTSGRTGASCTHGGFSVVRWSSESASVDATVCPVDGVGDDKWKHTCV